MTKKLVRHGNDLAVIIDKTILELLNVRMDTPLEITTNGTNIVASPRRTEEEDLLNASLNEINARFGITLARLGALGRHCAF
jgi:antitoxin component of MazEF toxin-antitoxin module